MENPVGNCKYILEKHSLHAAGHGSEDHGTVCRSADISYAGGVMRYRGIKVAQGGVPESVLTRER